MNTAELRRLAEEAEKTEYARQDASNIDHPNFPGYDEADAAEESSEKLNNYANPSALLELLDRLDAAEQFINDFKRSREKFLDMSGAHEYGSFNISELHRLHKRALEWQEATK